MNILVVDDNKKITELFENYFRLKGMTVTASNTPQNTLELHKKMNFDAIILDLSMPDFSGIDVIESFKKNQVDTSKIIILTAAHITDEEEKELLSKGIKALLRKPAELKTILEVIKS